MIGIPRCFTAGHTSAQYFVQAARRSSSPSLSIVDVIEGCKETTRLGVKSPSWERTGITCSGIYNYRMPLSINDPQAEALVKQLTEKTGETSEQVILRSLRERLDRVGNGHTESLAEELDQIGKRCAALPDVDKRSPDEILGYDENGLPT